MLHSQKLTHTHTRFWVPLHCVVSNMGLCSTFSNPKRMNVTLLFLISSNLFSISLRVVCVLTCNWPPVEVWPSSSRCFYNPYSPNMKCSPTHSCYFHQKALSPPPPPAPSPLPFLVKTQKERRGGRHPPMQGRANSTNLPMCMCVCVRASSSHEGDETA